MQSFLFVTSEIQLVPVVLDEIMFEEGKGKGARILATFCELDKASRNNRLYRFQEGDQMAKSLIGKSIRYGANWRGIHLKNVPEIGIVENAWKEGKKIKGIVRIWAKDVVDKLKKIKGIVRIWAKNIVDKLKKGVKFLFSVGGVAQFSETVKKGGKFVSKLYNAICTHLQLLPNNPKGAGFPSAKMHKIIEINESVMISQSEDVKVCDAYGCKILSEIKNEFEEAKIKEAVIEFTEAQIIARAIAEDIATITKVIMKEPWMFMNEEKG